MSLHQKFGIILENKVVQNLSLEKNVFNKKWSSKLIFLTMVIYTVGLVFSQQFLNGILNFGSMWKGG